ncbi:Asp23/Gls24 family envelope stress response protein [Streptomyces sp. NBC_00193]|uniref:DUF6286 domain-containing Asp23/Gls24 family envelope stress response protein n=1 Tax=Streptomyces sp. NBC_00193 TaxID=2975675 RepID=UPI002256E148|nr:DUF6286 domain-containing Asp23/Gls24 family envelope stress response protein [Streptomyces sp. NBC_00193]MCX5300570.1 Asp23/Gls24 family envelope stress response protein [Streptomyces sp. NBC_00193]
MTTIADRVVRKVAEQAAREALTGSGGTVRRGTASVRGHSAEVGVDIALGYRGVAGEAAHAVQEHVAERTAHLTGLHVPAPRIGVRALATIHGAPALVAGPAASPPERARGRRWSERRLPVGVLAVLALAVTAALLRDVAAVHLRGRAPAPWRGQVLGWLTGHGPATTPSWAAGTLVVAGLWMIVLALAPGHRSDLVMSTSDPGVRAVIGRRSASHLVRAAVCQVPGVTGARIRVGRRRLTVWADLAHGDRSHARDGVTEAVTGAVQEWGPAAPARTRVRVRVRPSPSWHPTPTPQEEGEADGPYA